MTRLLTALLYASLALTANPAFATDFGPGLRAELDALRADSLRKLAIHDEPRAAVEIAFAGLDGTVHSIADSNGKVRIVNFWATWCAPCRVEKPSLDALNATLSGPDFEVIAIATGRNSPAGIERFNKQHGIGSLATYVDPGNAAAKAMGVLGLPVTVILDRKGREVARLQGGADWNSDSSRAIISRLIGAGL